MNTKRIAALAALCALAAAANAWAVDVTPPSIVIKTPASGSIVSGAANVSGTASDASGTASVQVKVDAGLYQPATGTGSWSYSLDTTKLTNGAHTIYVKAVDRANNPAWAQVPVTVSNSAPGCTTSNTTWQNTYFGGQSASFDATFTAIPGMTKMDGVTGLANGAATGYPSLACAVRFNNAGLIDVRKGAAYAADAAIAYTAGISYKIRMAVNPVNHTYSVFVTPPGGAERIVASNYAFRTEQALTSWLSYVATQASAGAHQVCAFAVTKPAPDTTRPTVSVTSPLGGSSVAGTAVTLTATAADNVGVAGVQFRADGVNVGSEDTAAPFEANWNTTSLTNGPHVVTAVARDAAGNTTTSAGVTVTVSNSVAGADRFGIKQLYPTVSGGKSWTSTWDDGVARDFAGVDPRDAWFDANHGAASYSVDGKGLFKITGSTPRMYIHDPAKLDSWRNVEMTVYAMRVADDATPYAGIVGVARSNHGVTGDETVDLCDSRGYGARMRNDGNVDFDKETSHPNAYGVASKALNAGGLPKNVWIGYKYVVYDQADGTVKLEMWRDTTDGANGGTWVKVDEFVDNGADMGVGGVPCKSGIDPALKLLAGNTRAGSESGKPNITVYWRSTNVGTNGLVYKRMSVREIQPSGAAAPAAR